ncbi:PadR family transcriptional regulator [Rossellomorea marisflavi]|uniref:PadR family transcriptional regulator n=1 Tax=Rossellomorea marisflavi TaxID=189381 RepID=UPI0025C7B788|nr:PadR family transcriptional regulator [Rossellomorea marisflavi]UTE73709.1 PadR family transcriptional regulator [Rossellomorea marisflavi]GLI82713.1 PadR family transcriptional regulator [Rossellomorea marisflavi]
MNAQFKKGVLELVVMSIIRNGDAYGYSLIKKISDRINISEGTVYPILRKLVKEGHLTTYFQESNEGPARKYYSLTDSGKDQYELLASEWEEFAAIVQFFINKKGDSDEAR